MRKVSIEKTPCGKLSKLQRLILVMLCEPGLAAVKRRRFKQVTARLYWDREKRWGKDNRPSAAASLSRTFRRLEERQYIRSCDGRWTLTDYPPHDNGVVLAFLAWAREREFYAGLGLNGPPREALQAAGVIAAKPPARPGVKVELDC